VASEIAARRLQRAIEGYSYTTNKGKKVTVSGVGGAFRYATPSDSLFDERGNIRGSVTFADLARHVYFTETGEPLATRTNQRVRSSVVQWRSCLPLVQRQF